jgi:hypothetical protein
MIFGSGKISIKQMASVGFWVNLISAIIIILVVYYVMPIVTQNPTDAICLIDILPEPKIIAFGGVPTGNMYAQTNGISRILGKLN